MSLRARAGLHGRRDTEDKAALYADTGNAALSWRLLPPRSDCRRIEITHARGAPRRRPGKAT